MELENPDVIDMIPLAVIDVGSRARPVTPEAVALIVNSARDRDGGISTPIHVRRVKGGRFRLIDGAHRLAAAPELGLDAVPARVWTCTHQEALFMEVDANLSIAHVAPVDLAVSLARRKEMYLALHPETANGVVSARARQGHGTTNLSFRDYMAAVLGVSQRQIERIVSAGERLKAEEAAALRAGKRRIAMDDLYALAKISESEERSFVIDRLAAGAKPAAARRAFKGVEKPPETVFDARLKGLLTAWQRAGKATRRAFVAELFDELSPLVVDEAEGRDAAEIERLRTSIDAGGHAG